MVKHLMARPPKIIGSEPFDIICDAPDSVGARKLSNQTGLSTGLIDIIRWKECGDPIARARRLGLDSVNGLQTIAAALGPATTALMIPQTPMVNGSTMTHAIRGMRAVTGNGRGVTDTTTPDDATVDDLGDSDYADYDLPSVPDAYYPPTWVQPISFSQGLLNPFEAMNHAFTSAFNSRIATKVTELAQDLARKMIPDHNFEVTRPTNTILDTFKERVERLLGKQTKRTEVESKDEGLLKAPASTSTQPPNPPPDKPIVEKQSNPLIEEKLTNREDEDFTEKTGCSCLDHQKDTVKADSPNGTETHVGDGNPSEKTITGQSSDNIPITPPAFTPPQVPAESKEQQNLSTQNVSGNLSQPPQAPIPPLGLAEVAGPGMNNQLNTLTTPLTEGTRDKPETPDEALTKQSSSSPQQNTVQKPPNQQDSTSNRTITDQSQFPAIDQLQTTNQTGLPLAPNNGKTPSNPHTNHMDAPPAPPPPPKVEDKKSNGAPNDQPNVQGIIVNPEDTSLKSQPSVNHNLRNQALTFAAIVGIGVGALYVLKPEVRQWVSSHCDRIFHKASPQSASDGTFTQPQQNSNASTQGYARVNDPNGVAIF